MPTTSGYGWTEGHPNPVIATTWGTNSSVRPPTRLYAFGSAIAPRPTTLNQSGPGASSGLPGGRPGLCSAQSSSRSDRAEVVDVAGCECPGARRRHDQQATVVGDRAGGAEHCRAVRELDADRTAEGDAGR